MSQDRQCRVCGKVHPVQRFRIIHVGRLRQYAHRLHICRFCEATERKARRENAVKDRAHEPPI